MASDKEQIKTGGERPKADKKGLFGFLRLGRKKNAPQDALEQDAEPDAAVADANNETNDLDAGESAGKPKAARTRKKTIKKSAQTKSSTNKSAKSKTGTDKIAPAKKRGRPAKTNKAGDAPSDQVSDEQATLAASISAENVASDDGNVPQKRGLFSFFKRSKKSKADDGASGKTQADASAVPESEAGNDADEAAVSGKKGLFGFFGRKKAKKQAEAAVSSKSKEDDNADVLLAAITGIGVDGSVATGAEDEEEPEEKPKKRFLSKKLVIILFALFGVTGASGAAALVFAGPIFGDGEIKGLACSVAHRTDFELMRENRVTAFLRSPVMPPRERILMLIQYAKFLKLEYENADLITVSVIDETGPTHRSNFRGQYVGAQVVHAPDPLLTMATKEPWEVRYINTEEVFAGRYIGDRFKLTDAEISELKQEILGPSDCIAEIEAKLAAAEEAEEEGLDDESETASETSEADMVDEDQAAADNISGDSVESMVEGAMTEGEQEPQEPGFLDNMLAMVGLGGGDETPEDDVSDDELSQPYPADMPLEEVEMESAPDEGFFDGLLKMVGLGVSDVEEKEPIVIPGVLGRRVVYE